MIEVIPLLVDVQLQYQLIANKFTAHLTDHLIKVTKK